MKTFTRLSQPLRFSYQRVIVKSNARISLPSLYSLSGPRVNNSRCFSDSTQVEENSSYDPFRVKSKLKVLKIQEKIQLIDLSNINEDDHILTSRGDVDWEKLDEGEQDDLRNLTSYRYASEKEKLTMRRTNVTKKYQRYEGDTGSTGVQIAMLTMKINHLEKHMENHHKDKNTKRRIQIYWQRRRKLLYYCRKTAFTEFERVVRDFNIDEKENFMYGDHPSRKKHLKRFNGKQNMYEYKENKEKRQKEEKRIRKQLYLESKSYWQQKENEFKQMKQ